MIHSKDAEIQRLKAEMNDLNTRITIGISFSKSNFQFLFKLFPKNLPTDAEKITKITEKCRGLELEISNRDDAINKLKNQMEKLNIGSIKSNYLLFSIKFTVI